MSKIDLFIDRFFELFRRTPVADEIIGAKGDKEENIGIQKAFVSQFAENQNHQQRLFIQFLSSVLVVIIAYAYIYSNTASFQGINLYKIANKDTSVKASKKLDSTLNYSFVVNIQPNKFNSAKYENGAIISYSQLSLLSIYIFAQIVLLVLSIMILHMGYSYRRDQSVVSRIRKINLGMETYEKIYGTRNYSGAGKGFLEYLPNFNSILFFSICVIQVGLFISIFIYLGNYGHDEFISFGKTFITPPYAISYSKLSTSLFFPLLINLFIYTYYYNKYEFTVNKKDTYVPKMIKMCGKTKDYFIYYGVIMLSMAILLFSFLKINMYIHIWTFFYFYAIILLPIVFYHVLSRLNSVKAESYSQLFLGLTYMVCGTVLFFHSYYFFKRHGTYTIKSMKLSVILTACSVLVFVICNWIGICLSDKENSIARYLKGYNRFLFVLFYVFFIVYFMELKWLDYSVSAFFAIYAFLIGRRTFIKWRQEIYYF